MKSKNNISFTLPTAVIEQLEHLAVRFGLTKSELAAIALSFAIENESFYRRVEELLKFYGVQVDPEKKN